MQKQWKQAIYTFFFILLICLILTHSQRSIEYAMNGLNLWFTKMIPSLLPFMILSGIMVRLQLTEGFVSVIYPILWTVFRVRKNVIYAMFMGFFCGFPMGARVTCDLLERKLISQREGEFLLAFCNNIGPVYFTGFVLPLLHRRRLLPYLIGMYGIPLLYGIFLRYTKYRNLYSEPFCENALELVATEKKSSDFLIRIDESISAGIRSILSLGGYMILFNVLNLIPECVVTLCQRIHSGGWVNEYVEMIPVLIAPVLEITGGLGILGDRLPLCSLVLLSFGGFSCIAQTNSIIRNSDLSIYSYIYHKMALTALTVLYYTVWYLFDPVGFLL